MSTFEVIPGDPASPVILHVPHSSRSIPADVRAQIALSDHALEAELDAMTDARTDEIASLVAENCALTPWRFVNLASRLVIDPERFPDGREEMNAVGMGAVYTKTSAGDVQRKTDPLRDARLIADYFVPYADAFEQLVTERLEAVDTVTIIDIHSFPKEPLPYELHADGHRPPVCIGTDEFHTPNDLQEAAIDAFTRLGIDVALNSPFAGCYVPLSRYKTDTRARGLMVEMRRDFYLNPAGQFNEERLAGIAAALMDVIDRGSSRLNK